MRSLLLAAGAALAAAQTSGNGTLAWSQNVTYAVYTSAGVARHSSGPTFSFATWLNQPIEVVAASPASNTAAIWTFTASSSESQFHTVMARHSEALGTNAVDTIVQESFTDPTTGFPSCAIYGLISSGTKASATPVWNFTVPQCDTYTLDDSVVQVDVSDDGTTVAWCGAANETVNGKTYLTPRAWALDAQTGKKLWMKNLGIGAQPAVSSVRVSSSGAFIAYTYGATVYVMTRGGTQRGNLTNSDVSVPAAISDDGTYVAVGAPQTLDVWGWSGSAYALVHSLTPPGTTAWYPTDFAFSDTVSTIPGSAGDRAIAAVAWMDGEALTVRATMYNISAGTLVADWTSPTNAKLQNQAIVRLDGDIAAVGCWGDSDDIPTVVVLQAGSNTPVFTAVTPGSLFAIDVAITGVNDHGVTALVVAAGKSVPANMFGNGGNAFAWNVVAPNL